MRFTVHLSKKGHKGSSPRIVPLIERADPGPCGGAWIHPFQMARHDCFSA